MYDVAIIGAGINGCSVAYEFIQENKNVVVFDKEAIAAGGSGAAGAFISPKFSKSGELKEIINTAFEYAMKYYAQNFQQHFTQAQLLHITKDEERIFIDAGIVDAQNSCKAMLEGAKFIKESVDTLIYDDGLWIINDTHAAKEVILATGAYKNVVAEPYINLRGVWGHRIDIKTTTINPHSIHQFVSISPSKDGMLAIGATHNVHYHPQKNKEPYDIQSGREELLQKAAQTIKLENIEVVKDYMGLRSGSFDYMPLVGELVISEETLKSSSQNLKVKKADFSQFVYYPNLYMINGSGGYGFVLAPYLAKILKEHILSAKEISERISPARFFARWAKKL